MNIVIRAPGSGGVRWELPGSKMRRRPPPIVKGGRRTLYELAAAIAATGRRVEFRGHVFESVFEDVCNAAGARPVLDPEPRLPTPDDMIIVAESWPHALYAPYFLSGARCIMMLLAPPGLFGWPYSGASWEKPDPLTVNPASVGRPEHFRAIDGLGFEMWTQSQGLQAAALEAGTECACIGSGQPEPFPDPVAKEHDLVVLEHNRWAPLALAVAEESGRSLLRVPTGANEVVIRMLGSARVLVWPSRVEGHSRVQVEARAMGTVPVALSSNRFAEGLAEAGGAVMVDSVEEMVPAINELLDRPAELERLATRARDSARAQVDWQSYVERVDALLSREPPARDGAAANDRIYRELARNEYRLQARVRELDREGADGESRASGRLGVIGGLRRRTRPQRRSRRKSLGSPRPRPAGPAEPTVYAVGGYLPKGGGYMAYHLGRIVAARAGRRCRVVTVRDETAEESPWSYPEPFEAVTREEMEMEITGDDLLVANPSFSRNQFGLGLPARKLMYVQGFASLPVLDGFFDGYVCASGFLADLLRDVYGIEAPVIPPFVHLDRVPDGPPWRQRPSDRVLVMTKSSGERLFERFRAAMRDNHPSSDFSLTVAPAMPHDDLLELMSRHRYFLTLSPSEGFGLTPLEAMAAGCSVVGFHGGGGLEYMRPQDNCEVVSYPAIGALAERLESVLADAEAAERLAARGRETAQEYDLARFEERWEGYLERFLDG